MASLSKCWIILFLSAIVPLHSQDNIDSFKNLILTTKNDSLLCLHHLDLAMEYVQVQVDSALHYGRKGLELAEVSTSVYLRAAAYNIMGICYYYDHRPRQALEHYIMALPLARQSGDRQVLVKTLDNIGIIQLENGQPRPALERFEESLALYRLSGDSLNMGRAWLHLGSVYLAMDAVDSSIIYTRKALKVFEQIGSDFGRMICLGNLGEACTKQGNDHQARSYFTQSMQLARILGVSGSLSLALVGLAEVANKENQPEEALRWLDEAEKIVDESHDQRALIDILEEKAKAYFTVRKYAEAQATLQQRVLIGDSLNKGIYNQQLAELQIEYDNERKESQLARQALDLEQKNTQILRQRFSLGGLVLLIVVLLSGGWFFYRRNQEKQQRQFQEAIIQEQKLGLKAVLEAQEEEQRRVAKELHDGIAQELVAAKLSIDFLGSSLEPDQHRLREHVQSLGRLLQDTGTQVRQLSHTMLPAALEQQGMVIAIDQLLERTLGAAQLSYNFIHHVEEAALEAPLLLTIYRVLQEALNNILHHARASSVEVNLRTDQNHLYLTIRDNGQGFDPGEKNLSGTLGLTNMRSRVKNVRGTIKIESKAGEGTLIKVEIPR